MGYQQPYYVQIQRPPSNGLAITSMVLGIVAVCIGVWALVPFLGVVAAFVCLVPAVVAVVLGHLGLTRSRQMREIGRGQAMAGLVTGYVTLGIVVLTTAFWVLAFAGAAASTGINA